MDDFGVLSLPFLHIVFLVQVKEWVCRSHIAEQSPCFKCSIVQFHIYKDLLIPQHLHMLGSSSWSQSRGMSPASVSLNIRLRKTRTYSLPLDSVEFVLSKNIS